MHHGERQNRDADAFARIGPNAVIQLGVILKQRLGNDTAAKIFAEAGLSPLLDAPPAEMVDERDVNRLYRVLFLQLPETEAQDVAGQAGMMTGSYILANRIPRLVQMTLKALPPPLAAAMLLKAIRRNAWTFAGSGAVTCKKGTPHIIEIADNPVAMPGCSWHRGVFEKLFATLVSRDCSVRHTACCLAGDPACRFEINTRAR